jgi:hypothetical protein
MSDGGMHASFNGLSSIREFSVAELKEHLVALRDAEIAHLEKTLKQFPSSEDDQSESQRLFVGLINNKVDSYSSAVEALENGASNVKAVKLDISRPLPSQITEAFAQPTAVRKTHAVPRAPSA